MTVLGWRGFLHPIIVCAAWSEYSINAVHIKMNILPEDTYRDDCCEHNCIQSPKEKIVFRTVVSESSAE